MFYGDRAAVAVYVDIGATVVVDAYNRVVGAGTVIKDKMVAIVHDIGPDYRERAAVVGIKSDSAVASHIIVRPVRIT